MRKKKHNADEIRFCQSRMHRQVYEFQHGEISFLISVDWEGGNPMRMVVCKDCYKQKMGVLVKEILIEKTRIPVPA